jgi:hypothetical protein
MSLVPNSIQIPQIQSFSWKKLLREQHLFLHPPQVLAKDDLPDVT